MGEHRRGPLGHSTRNGRPVPPPPLPGLILESKVKLMARPKAGVRIVAKEALITQDGKTFVQTGAILEEFDPAMCIVTGDKIADVAAKLDVVAVLIGLSAEPSVLAPDGQVRAGGVGLVELARVDYRDFRQRCQAAADGVQVPDFVDQKEPWEPPPKETSS